MSNEEKQQDVEAPDNKKSIWLLVESKKRKP